MKRKTTLLRRRVQYKRTLSLSRKVVAVLPPRRIPAPTLALGMRAVWMKELMHFVQKTFANFQLVFLFLFICLFVHGVFSWRGAFDGIIERRMNKFSHLEQNKKKKIETSRTLSR
jgi:hypothetical protein